jgi:hypothetical protein
MKRAKYHAPPRPPKKRNPVAVSPLLRKGGAHGKTTAAKRRQEKVALGKALRDGDIGE